MKAAQPELYASLARRRGLTDAELGEYAAVAAALPLRTRAEDGVVMQCDGFEQLEDIDFASVWTDRSRPFGISFPRSATTGSQGAEAGRRADARPPVPVGAR